MFCRLVAKGLRPQLLQLLPAPPIKQDYTGDKEIWINVDKLESKAQEVEVRLPVYQQTPRPSEDRDKSARKGKFGFRNENQKGKRLEIKSGSTSGAYNDPACLDKLKAAGKFFNCEEEGHNAYACPKSKTEAQKKPKSE